MKLSLKVMSLVALIGMGNNCSASITFGYNGFRGEACLPKNEINAVTIGNVFNRLMNPTVPTIPEAPIISSPTIQTPAVATPALTPLVTELPNVPLLDASSKTNVMTQAEMDRMVNEKVQQGIGDFLKKQNKTAEVTIGNNSLSFRDFINGFKSSSSWQNTAARLSVAAVFGLNAIKRWNQVVSAYNRNQIRNFIGSSCLAAISSAGALVASNSACCEKVGTTGSMLLMATALADTLWQSRFSRIKLDKDNLDKILENTAEKVNVHCFICKKHEFESNGIKLNENNEEQMSITNDKYVNSKHGLSFSVRNSSQSYGIPHVCIACAMKTKV